MNKKEYWIHLIYFIAKGRIYPRTRAYKKGDKTTVSEFTTKKWRTRK